MRDIVCYKKRTYGEFVASRERISSRTLAMRLEHLVKAGILVKQTHESDKRKEAYALTDKGRSAIPILIELATWGAEFDPQTDSPHSWIDAVQADKADPDPSERAVYFEAGWAR